MARPTKCKRICRIPEFINFNQSEEIKESISLTIEEFECIRLIDYEGMTQEECAKIMNAGRTTIQSIYSSARKKIADFLVNGKSIKIEGGNYSLCPKHDHCQKQCFKKCGQCCHKNDF